MRKELLEDIGEKELIITLEKKKMDLSLLKKKYGFNLDGNQITLKYDFKKKKRIASNFLNDLTKNSL